MATYELYLRFSSCGLVRNAEGNSPALGMHIRSFSQYWQAVFLLRLLTEVFPAAWEKCGLRGVPSAPEDVQSTSSPAGVSVESSLLAGPVGKTGD